jgi:hypothetical protein
VAGAAKDVAHFVANEFFDLITRRSEIFARIEFLRVFRKHFADRCGHREAQVGVDVDLGASDATRHFDIRFGNTGSVFAHLAAVFVDFDDQVLRNARSSVQHQRIIAETCIGQSGFDRFQAFEVQVLFTFKFVGTVRVADRDSERINAGLFHEFNSFFRVRVSAALGITAAFFAFVVLRADKHAEFAFNDAVMFVRVFDNAFANFNVLFERLVRTIDHDAGEAVVDAFFAKLEGITVVQVNRDRDVGRADSGFDQFFEVNGMGVFACAAGDLQHDGRFFLLASFHDGLEKFHVVHVKRAERIFALEGFRKKIFGMCQWHIAYSRILSVAVCWLNTVNFTSADSMERNARSEREKFKFNMTRIKCLVALAVLLLVVVGVSAEQLSPLIATNASDWNTRREQIKTKWLKILGPLPTSKVPLHPEILETETTPKFIRKHIRYQTETNVFTDGYLLLPNPTKTKCAAIVVFHPTTPLQAKGVAGLAKDYAEEKWQGVQLVERGYVVWCPRNYINGEGADWSGNAKRVLKRHPKWTGMTQMVWDANRAADFVQSLPEVDANRIGCIGHSLGGKQALYAAAFDERYKASVASELGIGLKFSNWDALWYFGPAMHNFPPGTDNHEVLALVAPRPFLLLAGDSADGDKSLNYINAVAPVYGVFGARTNLNFLNHHLGHRYAPQARDAAEKFLDQHLHP